MANENELREKYRTAKLETCLDCDATKAAEMSKRLSRLNDQDFDSYASHSAETLADLKARASMPGAVPTRKANPSADTDKVRASIADYVASESSDVGEDE